MVNSTVLTVNCIAVIFFFKRVKGAVNRNTHWFLQGLAWERWSAHVQSKVFPHCIGMQLLLVSSTRISILNAHEHLMDLLGILQISNSSANWIRHEGPWAWSYNPRLVCCGILLVQPPHLPFLCHRQRLRRVHVDNIHRDPNSILGVWLVWCFQISHFLIALIHITRSEVRYLSHCEWQVWARYWEIWGARADKYEHVLCSHLRFWFCYYSIHSYTRGIVLWKVKHIYYQDSTTILSNCTLCSTI